MSNSYENLSDTEVTKELLGKTITQVVIYNGMVIGLLLSDGTLIAITVSTFMADLVFRKINYDRTGNTG